MISSKRSKAPRPRERVWPKRRSTGWEITIILDEELRAESINTDEPGEIDLNPDEWLGEWIDDIFCSEEDDTFISSSIIANLDLPFFELNVSLKNIPSLKTCARVKKLYNGRTHKFLFNCYFWKPNTHHPFTGREAFEFLREDSELWFCDLDFEQSQFKISPALWVSLGYSVADLKPDRESFKKLVHPDDHSFFDIRDQTQRINPYEESYNFRQEIRLMHAEGIYRWIEAFGVKYYGENGKKGRIYGTFRDVTVRKLVEENFRESENRFNLLLNSRNIGFFDFDLSGKNGIISNILKRMLGYDVNELEDTFDQLETLVHPDDRKHSKIDYEEGKKEIRNTYVRECRMLCKNGDFLWVQINGVFFRAPGGKIVRRTGFLTNIEKKKAAELALCEEQERMRVTLSSIKDAVIATNNEGHIVIFNQTAEHWFNVKAEELMGKRIPKELFIVNPKTRAPFPLDENLQIGEGPTDDFKFKGVIKGPDGQEIILSRSYAPLKDNHGEVIGTVLIYHDITSSERYANEMIKSSKMESMGLLAGGIAHDFNNLLTTILGNISLVQNKFASIDVLDQSEQACLMAKDLTQQLLTFA
ncbi:MAG: PAS domain S-box protein, partial [Verrucomicrobia bacterium]|nr:PAS domain S-box protein [Verrucomicrobiota bacterium]